METRSFLWRTLVVSATLVTATFGADVCYGDLGCFTTDYPWSGTLERPIASLPRAPEELQIQFILRTRGGPSDGQIVRPGDRGALLGSNFDGRRPTKFISHGFIENGFVSWITDMSNAFLRAEDCNVFGVDWGSHGGSMLPYTQATANTQLVGATIAQFVNLLVDEAGASLDSIHLIGHSLGSHIMGYAGDRLNGVGRITGMDPAQPYFQGTDPIVRLDPTDAQLVDVIHSDGGFFFTSLGLGMYDPVGHLDFYPNGGIEMAGCDQGLFDFIELNGGIYAGGREFVACNHLKSIEYMHDSIDNTCPMMGYPCRDYDRFKDGHCLECGSQGCAQMGYHADQYAPSPGVTNLKYYLSTAERAPHCVYHYQVKLTLGTSSSAGDVHGTPQVSFVTQNAGATEYFGMTDGSIKLQPGNTYQYFLTTPADFGSVLEVRFRWDYDWSLMNPGSWPIWFTPKIWVDQVQVMAGESQQRRTFCGFNAELTENVPLGMPFCV